MKSVGNDLGLFDLGFCRKVQGSDLVCAKGLCLKFASIGYVYVQGRIWFEGKGPRVWAPDGVRFLRASLVNKGSDSI